LVKWTWKTGICKIKRFHFFCFGEHPSESNGLCRLIMVSGPEWSEQKQISCFHNQPERHEGISAKVNCQFDLSFVINSHAGSNILLTPFSWS
jgi:hypothetical protein